MANASAKQSRGRCLPGRPISCELLPSSFTGTSSNRAADGPLLAKRERGSRPKRKRSRNLAVLGHPVHLINAELID